MYWILAEVVADAFYECYAISTKCLVFTFIVFDNGTRQSITIMEEHSFDVTHLKCSPGRLFTLNLYSHLVDVYIEFSVCPSSSTSTLFHSHGHVRGKDLANTA